MRDLHESGRLSKTEPSIEASHISAHQALDIHFGVEIASWIL